MTWRNRLGTVGVWRGVKDLDPALSTTIEDLGFGTIWQGGSPGSDLRAAEVLLDATESLQLATGIVNIWNSDPAELADSYHRVEARHPGRLLLGIGSGHREATPQRVRPLDAMATAEIHTLAEDEGSCAMSGHTRTSERASRFSRYSPKMISGSSWVRHGVTVSIRTR